jgi:glycosyltransferase involved in cell wall biosynthesis
VISVVVTVYNREKYLAQTIESILAQNWRDFELLIWDDGSSDRSLDIALGYGAIDDRIKVIAAPHQGFGQSLNSAIALTKGEYLGWVDSDDILEPTALEKTREVLEAKPEIGVVYTDYCEIDQAGRFLRSGKRCSIPYTRDRLLVDMMVFHFRLIRRSVYEQVGGIDPSFECAPDYDLFLKLSEVAPIQHIPFSLYRYRIHSDRISCANRLKQIEYSYRAVNNALVRRGMGEGWELEVRTSFTLSTTHKRQ